MSLAAPVSDPATRSADRLVEQVTGTVRWRESVAFMASARRRRVFVEVGAGKVLAGLVKRIADGATGVAVGTPDDIAAADDASLPLALRRLSGRRRCSISPARRRWSPAPPAASAARSRARCTRRARRVALSGTRREALEALAGELGERAHVLPCDLADRDAVEALVPAAEAALGPARHPRQQCRHHPRQSVRAHEGRGLGRRCIAVNLTAAFRLARAALRGMMRRRFGRIIAITSVVGVTGNPGQGNYAAAKAGLIGMIKSLAQEVASRSITVNCVAPGFIATAMTDVLNDKQREAILAQVPAGRLGTADGDRRGGGLSGRRRGRPTSPARRSTSMAAWP